MACSGSGSGSRSRRRSSQAAPLLLLLLHTAAAAASAAAAVAAAAARALLDDGAGGDGSDSDRPLDAIAEAVGKLQEHHGAGMAKATRTVHCRVTAPCGACPPGAAAANVDSCDITGRATFLTCAAQPRDGFSAELKVFSFIRVPEGSGPGDVVHLVRSCPPAVNEAEGDSADDDDGTGHVHGEMGPAMEAPAYETLLEGGGAGGDGSGGGSGGLSLMSFELFVLVVAAGVLPFVFKRKQRYARL